MKTDVRMDQAAYDARNHDGPHMWAEKSGLVRGIGADVANNEVAAQIARNVAYHRQVRGWTLTALARRSGLSTRTLAKLEEGHNATVNTLLSVADAFDISLASLMFDPTNRQPEIHVIRQGDTEPVDLGARLVRHLCHALKTEHLQLAHVVLPAESRRFVPRGEALAIERIFVIDGSLEYGPPDNTVMLTPGDFATAKADCPRVQDTRDGASLLVLTTREPAEGDARLASTTAQ